MRLRRMPPAAFEVDQPQRGQASQRPQRDVLNALPVLGAQVRQKGHAPVPSTEARACRA